MAIIETNHASYEGTERDVKKSFNLTHKGDKIFERYFDGSDASIVSIASSTIYLKNHFFVSGELVKYDNGGGESIGIATTSFAGIGLTDKLPSELFVVKVDQNIIKLARSAEDALKIIPKTLDITSVGIGSSHRFTSVNQNSKVLVAIDNVIQSPIVSTSTTTVTTNEILTTDDIIYVSNPNYFFNNDLIRIDDEIMRIESIGVGNTNAVRVFRPWMGTNLNDHSIGSLVSKVVGNYNIVENIINFSSPPYGNVPLSTSTNPPDERDWENISTRSSFQGRTFIRSGIPNSSTETYSKNYIFDDISSEFDGFTNDLTLSYNNSNITEIEDENAIILINNILQGPGLKNDYVLNEASGITSISFTGNASSTPYDVNTASIPRGGIIVSVGSTEGFGYQPLVSAGGTAIVSIAGTISSISIGNSGSGYRSGIQTVNVGVTTFSDETPDIEFIGTATISNGNIVSVSITNPGSGYTFTNPPYVVFDSPLPYSDIPLIYSSSSPAGVGETAKINIVVGQGSSVIDFEITNTGYGYRDNEILTIPIGGSTGIPTTGQSFREFQISIQKTKYDDFAGWFIGEIQVLDKLDNKFDGKRTVFPLTLSSNPISIIAKKGSNINIQDNLLVFINDILQVPGEGYIFNGGSKIKFTEPPRQEDTSKILFYRGTKNVDVLDVDIIETVKVGDNLTIGYDESVGQSPFLQEDYRTVMDIATIDIVNTNPYFGPGNVDDETLLRPVKWCRQTEDMIINEQEVSKGRPLNNALINPISYLIQPVGVGSTIVYVDNIRPFFNSLNENDVSLEFQKFVTFIPQESKVNASATAIVSTEGTVSSIQVNDGGSGYTNEPKITIQSPLGIGTTVSVNAVAIPSITNGSVTSIDIINSGVGYTFTNPPLVLIEPPTALKEVNTVETYEGDFGHIIGISTGSVGIATTALIFDFYIPTNSFLRNNSISNPNSIEVSGIQSGYYFIVYNSNVGGPIVSLDNLGSTIGVGTTFIDNVYQVSSVSIGQTDVTGIGVTYVAKVVVNVENYDSLIGINAQDYYGEFSWGRIYLESRTKQIEYNSYTMNGIVGLTTGTIVSRTNPLRFSNYIS